MEIEFDQYETFHVYVYSRSPNIIYALLNPFGKMPITSLLARHSQGPSIIFCNNVFSLEVLRLNHPWFDRYVQSIKEFLAANSANKFIFLANTLQECQIMKTLGVDHIFVNQNSFLNQEKINILSEKKSYNAIYNAQFIPFKRHYLASKVENLALLYGLWGDQEKLFNEMKMVLPNATYLNGRCGVDVPDSEKFRYFNHNEVNSYLCQSYVGLCLSGAEGAMYASFEYLLAGLPVVSTPNLGGRDIMMPPEFSRIVEPHEDAIAASVNDFVACNIDPHDIRAAALALSQQHRNRYEAILMQVTRDSGADESIVHQRYQDQKNLTYDGVIKRQTQNLIDILNGTADS